ncbi:MAG TPA: hypothetical protein VMU05_03010 [Dongiaceae bacterium]|nr:hypothetical protein [Dongiaceae bacterium]
MATSGDANAIGILSQQSVVRTQTAMDFWNILYQFEFQDEFGL